MSVIRRSGLINRPPFARRELEGLLSAMLRALGQPADASLTLVVTDDRESAELNTTHLGCRGPTNILSFPESEDGEHGERNLGTLVLSAPALRRECLLYGQPENEHLVRLLAHGLTHLLGYDHGPEMDALSHEAFRGGLAFVRSLDNESDASRSKRLCKA